MSRSSKKQRESTRKEGETRGRKPIWDIRLNYSHTINDQRYGPGDVHVPEAIAQVLLEQERNVSRSLRYAQTSGSAMIGLKGRLIAVPSDFFDGGKDLHTDPLIHVSGGDR